MGLALVLAAAFCHATWNFFVKRLNGGPELVWLFSVFSALLYFPLIFYIFLYLPLDFGWTGIGFIAGSAVIHLGCFLLLQESDLRRRLIWSSVILAGVITPAAAPQS